MRFGPAGGQLREATFKQTEEMAEIQLREDELKENQIISKEEEETSEDMEPSEEEDTSEDMELSEEEETSEDMESSEEEISKDIESSEEEQAPDDMASSEEEETSGDMEPSEELSEEESEDQIEKRLNKEAHKGPKTGAGMMYSEEDTSPARQTFYQSHIFPMPLLETLKVTECNQETVKFQAVRTHQLPKPYIN